MAPNAIAACNGPTCAEFLEDMSSHDAIFEETDEGVDAKRVLVDFPGVWTEIEGGYQTWGGSPDHPTAYFWGRGADDAYGTGCTRGALEGGTAAGSAVGGERGAKRPASGYAAGIAVVRCDGEGGRGPMGCAGKSTAGGPEGGITAADGVAGREAARLAPCAATRDATRLSDLD